MTPTIDKDAELERISLEAAACLFRYPDGYYRVDSGNLLAFAHAIAHRLLPQAEARITMLRSENERLNDEATAAQTKLLEQQREIERLRARVEFQSAIIGNILECPEEATLSEIKTMLKGAICVS